MTGVGWHLLEHIIAVISTIVLKHPPSYPYPLPPLTPSTAHSSGRRSLESAKDLHCGGPRKEIYLPWQRHQQLSSGCPFPLPHSPSPAPAVAHVVSTSHCPQMMSTPCPAPRGSSLGFRELSLPNAEVSEWLLSLSTEQSLKMPERGPMAHLDIGWEVGDLSEILTILNSFFLTQARVDVSAMLLKAPLALSSWYV